MGRAAHLWHRYKWAQSEQQPHRHFQFFPWHSTPPMFSAAGDGIYSLISFYFFPLPWTRKLKSLERFCQASRASFLQGHWEIDWESLPALMMLWLCFMGAVSLQERWGKAIPVKLSSTHPPTCGLSPVVALAKKIKWRHRGLCHEIPSALSQSISRQNPHCSLQLGWIIVHTRFTAVLVAPTRSTGCSWMCWSQVVFLPQGVAAS